MDVIYDTFLTFNKCMVNSQELLNKTFLERPVFEEALAGWQDVGVLRGWGAVVVRGPCFVDLASGSESAGPTSEASSPSCEARP